MASMVAPLPRRKATPSIIRCLDSDVRRQVDDMILTDKYSYIIIVAANGYVLRHSFSALNPYVVWKVDDNCEGVSCGHYFNDREEAEWDFCARAFEWFEDNVNILIEDGEESSEAHSVFDTPTSKEQPLSDFSCVINGAGRYSGNCLMFKITYILDDPKFCKDGMVVLGLAQCEI